MISPGCRKTIFGPIFGLALWAQAVAQPFDKPGELSLDCTLVSGSHTNGKIKLQLKKSPEDPQKPDVPPQLSADVSLPGQVAAKLAGEYAHYNANSLDRERLIYAAMDLLKLMENDVAEAGFYFAKIDPKSRDWDLDLTVLYKKAAPDNELAGSYGTYQDAHFICPIASATKP